MNHFAIQLKEAQHCKSAILQSKTNQGRAVKQNSADCILKKPAIYLYVIPKK